MSELASIRDAMELRFPYADFRAYFEFLDTRAGGGDHHHHVAPRCEFPELDDDWDNVALLTYRDHVRAHRLLSKAVPEHFGFRYAMWFMSGQKEKAMMEAAKKGGAAAEQAGSLKKARAVLSASGHPQIAKMHAAPNFRETQLIGLARARAKMAAAGWPHLAKIKEAAGGPRAFSMLGVHVRCHVNKGIISSSCKLCNA